MAPRHAKAQPAEPYEVLGHLGAGSFGQVKKIKRRSDGKVSLLWVHRRRFLTRLQILAMKKIDLRGLEPEKLKAVDDE